MLLKIRAGKAGWEHPCGHMEARLKPSLPFAERIRRLGKDFGCGSEQPGARFQLLATLWALEFMRGNGLILLPEFKNPVAEALCRIGDQSRGRHVTGRSSRRLIQARQSAFTKTGEPAVQGGRVWVPAAHILDSLPQSQMR